MDVSQKISANQNRKIQKVDTEWFHFYEKLLKLIYIRYWGQADWREMGAMELSGLMHMFYFLVSRDNVLPWCYMGVDNCQNPSSCPPNMCAFYCILIYL